MMQRALTIEDLFQKYQPDKGVPLSSDVIRWANKFGSTIEPEEEVEFRNYYKNLLAQANPQTYLGGESSSYSNDGMGGNHWAQREAELQAADKTQAEIDATLRAEQVADRAKIPEMLAKAVIPGLAAIKGLQNFLDPPTISYAKSRDEMTPAEKAYADNTQAPVTNDMVAEAEANDAAKNAKEAAALEARGISLDDFGGPGGATDPGFGDGFGYGMGFAEGGAVRFNEGGPTLEEMASDDRSMVDRVIDTLPDNFFGVPISPDTYKNLGMTGLGYMLGIGPLMSKYNQAKYGTKAAINAYDMSMGNMPAFRGYSAPVENRSTYSDDAINEAMDKAIQSGEMAKGTDVDGSAGGSGGGDYSTSSDAYSAAGGVWAKGGLIDKASWADGGPVKTHYAEGDSVRATPQNAALGSIANLIKKSYSPRRTQQMQSVSKFLDMPALARTVERLSYGEPITNIGKANVPLIPEDTAAAAMLVGPPLGSFAKRVGTNLIQTAPAVLGDMLESAASPMRSYVIKPKGGNWLAGGIEEAVGQLKRDTTGRALEDAAAYNYKPEINLEDAATNNWIDKTLYKYIKNDMGTPEDPMRALAERGPMHVDTDQVNYILDAYGKYPKPGQEFLAKSDLAKVWEGAVDNNISTERAGKFLDLSDNRNPYAHARLQENPWLSKVPPETQVNQLSEPENLTYDLGFYHMIDEMRNAMEPGSGLPARLMIDPAKLEKMTVPQISERVGQINAWRAAQKIEADLARSMNPATQIVKEYPDQGMRWVELKIPDKRHDVKDMLIENEGKYSILEPGNKLAWKDPKTGRVLFDSPEKAAEAFSNSKNYSTLEDALKYEGETMGHCVGGYCPEVVSGNTRIYSLRDAKGQPHVTIETQPSRSNSIKSMREGNPTDYKITQIKGKSNLAPKEDYLPFVQDFVKGGQWTEVGDIKNSGLIDLQDPNAVLRMLQKVSPERNIEKAVDTFNGYIRANPQSSRYITADEIGKLFNPPPEGFADGGMVGDPIAAYDPLQIDLVMNSIDAPRAYAEGGSAVKNAATDFMKFLDNHGLSMSDVIAAFGKRGMPLSAAFYSGELNTDEDLELRARRMQKPTITEAKYAQGGSVSVYDPNQIDAIVNQYM